jgi:hypothetical protein
MPNVSTGLHGEGQMTHHRGENNPVELSLRAPDFGGEEEKLEQLASQYPGKSEDARAKQQEAA